MGVVGVSSPRFVGRSQQLDALSAGLARATAGDPTIVVVTGAAGVGKSRLIAEFSALCSAIGALVLVGDCLDLVGDGLPFGPVAAILRDLARTTDPDRLEAVLGPARDELARLVPDLGSGATSDGAAASSRDATDTPDVDATRGQARLFERLLAVLGRLGDEAPTVLVLEDVHWIDPATQDLVSFLARSLREERVLLVLTSRIEHLPRAHPHAAWLAELSRNPLTQTLTLEPLSAEETSVQLEAILGAPAEPDLAAAVHRRSEGNPLFNEELLAATRSGSSELPAILSDALGARFRGLPARSLDVLEVAAVASRSIDERFLAAILGGDQEEYLEPVREAVVAQILIAGPTTYRFRHGLYAEAIVGDLTPGERRNLHGRIATALEANPDLAEGGPAWVAGESADHWLAADRAEEAYRCAIGAGLAAAAMYAHRVAHGRWEQALAIENRVPASARAQFLEHIGFDQSELLIRTAQVAAMSEEHSRALELAGRAVAYVDSEAQPARSAGCARSTRGSCGAPVISSRRTTWRVRRPDSSRLRAPLGNGPAA